MQDTLSILQLYIAVTSKLVQMDAVKLVKYSCIVNPYTQLTSKVVDVYGLYLV